MKRKKKLIFLLVFVLLIGTVPTALAGFIPGTGETIKVHLMDAANPTASPVTYPDGQQYIELNNTYKVGDTFTVWANVTDVTELNMYQVGVTYNDSVLECTGYSEGEFFYRAPEEYRTDLPNQPILADGSGFLGYWNHVTWVLKKPGNVSGTGTLAVFNFKVVGYGVTLIDIVLSGPQAATLRDVYSNDIDFNTIDINTGLAPSVHGCTLFVWNGSEYVEETTLDIHSDSDVTLQHVIEQPLISEQNAYRLSLRELDEFTSHLDYVKLHVVDSYGEAYDCHLKKAIHSQLENVKNQLLHNDDSRVDLEPSQTIDLEFTVPKVDEIAYFIFEIDGYNR